MRLRRGLAICVARFAFLLYCVPVSESSGSGEPDGGVGDCFVYVVQEDSVVNELASLVLSCRYECSGIYTVQWTMSNEVLKAEEGIPGSRGELNYTITHANPKTDMGTYSCTICTAPNMEQAAHSSVTVIVSEIPDPVFNTDKPSYSVEERAMLLCYAAASTNVSVDRMRLLGPKMQILNETRGNLSVSLTIPEVSCANFGQHLCIAESRAGNNTTSIIIQEKAYFQIQMLWDPNLSVSCASSIVGEQYTVILLSIQEQVLELLRGICHCDVDDSAFDTNSSQLTCSTNGRGLTYRAMLTYSSEEGTITASKLISKLQVHVYDASPLLTIDILGSNLSVVIECNFAINNLTAPLCLEPEAPTNLYNDPFLFFSIVAGAIALGFLCGIFFMGITICACKICKKKRKCQKMQSKRANGTSNAGLTMKNTYLDDMPENIYESEDSMDVINGFERSTSFSTGSIHRPAQRKTVMDKVMSCPLIHVIPISMPLSPPASKAASRQDCGSELEEVDTIEERGFNILPSELSGTKSSGKP